jgi:hypothetical protein
MCLDTSQAGGPGVGTEERVGTAIAGQYGSSSGQGRQMFGKVDPFCFVAVVPMVIAAVLFIWGGIAIMGVALIVLALLVVVFDSWANRPARKNAPPRNR